MECTAADSVTRKSLKSRGPLVLLNQLLVWLLLRACVCVSVVGGVGAVVAVRGAAVPATAAGWLAGWLACADTIRMETERDREPACLGSDIVLHGS